MLFRSYHDTRSQCNIDSTTSARLPFYQQLQPPTITSSPQCLPQLLNTSTFPTSLAAKCSASLLTKSRQRATSPSLPPNPSHPPTRPRHPTPATRHHRQACRASRKASDELIITLPTFIKSWANRKQGSPNTMGGKQRPCLLFWGTLLYPRLSLSLSLFPNSGIVGNPLPTLNADNFVTAKHWSIAEEG